MKKIGKKFVFLILVGIFFFQTISMCISVNNSSTDLSTNKTQNMEIIFEQNEQPLINTLVSASGGSGSSGSFPDQSLSDFYQLDEVHKYTNGSGAKILIIDNPIDKRNEYLSGHLDEAKCLYLEISDETVTPKSDYINDIDWSSGDFGHGTKIAGVIAQVAPKTEIMCLGITDVNYLSEAVLYLKDHWNDFQPDIITISIHDITGGTSDTTTEENLKDFARVNGALVTICVGNIKVINDVVYDKIAWPANKIAQTEGVIGVGAIYDYGDNIRKKTDFSRINTIGIEDGLEITAPGANIVTTDVVSDPNNPYDLIEDSGTSYSTPLVAALAALSKEYSCGTFNAAAFENRLYRYSWSPWDTVSNMQEIYHGHGIANCRGMFIPDYDSDFDGLTDKEEALMEYYIDSNIYFDKTFVDLNVYDTDFDGLSDSEEISYNGVNFDIYSYPNVWDSDSDGISDGYEVTISHTNPLNPDSDGDGLDDSEEISYGNDGYVTDPNDYDSDDDLLSDGYEVSVSYTDPTKADTDTDGLDDYQEVAVYFSNPLYPDTDGDGLTDGDEVNIYLSDPVAVDSDLDGIIDGVEVYTYGTSPIDTDTDNDGMDDGFEIIHNLNPLANDAAGDPDNDGLTNISEYSLGTDPRDSDTDGDGMPDGWEVTYSLNPKYANDAILDSDGDNLNNIDEYLHGTSPNNPDCDGDGITDREEVFLGSDGYITDPLDADTDGDTINDYEETTLGSDGWLSNPTSADGDSDGISDVEEVTIGTDGYITNPLSTDTDGDSVSDYAEIFTHNTNPTTGDSDGDGLNDFQELFVHFTLPNDSDTDNDGLSDGEEAYLGSDGQITDPNDCFDPHTQPENVHIIQRPSTSELEVSWNGMSGVLQYKIEYKHSGESTFHVVYTTSSSITLTALLAGAEYTILISAQSNYNSAWSNTICDFGWTRQPQPATPTTSLANYNEITVNYYKSTSATHVALYYKTGSGSWILIGIYTSSGSLPFSGSFNTQYSFCTKQYVSGTVWEDTYKSDSSATASRFTGEPIPGVVSSFFGNSNGITKITFSWSQPSN